MADFDKRRGHADVASRRKELFYVAPGGTIMSVDVKSSDSSFAADTPKMLFKMPGQISLGSSRNDYLVSGAVKDS